MASFEAKISWGRPRKRENKKRKKSFRRVRTRPIIENSKKKAKKFKKLKTNILATFQAKISWEWPRKREKKNRSKEFLPDQ